MARVESYVVGTTVRTILIANQYNSTPMISHLKGYFLSRFAYQFVKAIHFEITIKHRFLILILCIWYISRYLTNKATRQLNCSTNEI